MLQSILVGLAGVRCQGMRFERHMFIVLGQDPLKLQVTASLNDDHVGY